MDKSCNQRVYKMYISEETGDAFFKLFEGYDKTHGCSVVIYCQTDDTSVIYTMELSQFENEYKKIG